MNSQLAERIRQKSGSFSKGQRMIARYIEEHSDQVAFMTASKLGQTVGGQRIHSGAVCHGDRLLRLPGPAAGHGRR